MDGCYACMYGCMVCVCICVHVDACMLCMSRSMYVCFAMVWYATDGWMVKGQNV